MRKFSASWHFFKTNVTQSVAEFILFSQKNTKLWSFSIKFGELRCKNIQQHFHARTGLRLKRLSSAQKLNSLDESESFSDLCLEQHLEQHLTYIERQHTKIITIKPIHPATIAPISDGEQQKLNKQDDSEPE